VQFVNPLILLAGFAIAIPIAIHLFNLRKFQTVFFPHTRFLSQLNLKSKRTSELQHKWLLLVRCLLLLSLVAAFAQPFFTNGNTNHNTSTQAIFIDNSLSMSNKIGQKTLLDVAKEQAMAIVNASNGPFIIVTNNGIATLSPVNKEKAAGIIEKIIPAVASQQSEIIIEQLKHNELADKVALHYISDFQKSQFQLSSLQKIDSIAFTGYPITDKQLPSNMYIDTAFLEQPQLQQNIPKSVIVKTKLIGKENSGNTILQLHINDQLKSAKSIAFTKDTLERIDTLTFETAIANWQKMYITIESNDISFDDTFRISTKPSKGIHVAMYDHNGVNPFIATAFNINENVTLKKLNASTIEQHEIDEHSLFVFSNVQKLDAIAVESIQKALDASKNVLISFVPNADISNINNGLSSLCQTNITGIDTLGQQVNSLNKTHATIKDIFEHIPEAVQLPFAQQHYKLKSAPQARQQNIMSFRNGDPFLVSFQIGNGQLYLCTAPIENNYSDFQNNPFFAPFLYQTAFLASPSYTYAYTLGTAQPLKIVQESQVNTQQQYQKHLIGDGVDMIPAQQFIGQHVQLNLQNTPITGGFYTIITPQSKDSAVIATNYNRLESDISHWSLQELGKANTKNNIHWNTVDFKHINYNIQKETSFPLWKVCAILALILLLLETWIISRNNTVTISES
jgi:hypothetical protein